MIIGIIIIIACIFIDQITKILARLYLKNKEDIKLGFVNLTYLENSGGAMGTFSGNFWFLTISTIITLAILVIFGYYFDLEEDLIFSLGLCILTGGIFGNFFDRVIFGYVTDFFYFKFKKITPVFNLADMFIFFGMILFTIGVFL